MRSAKEYTTFWEGLGLVGLYCLYVFGVSLVGHGCETQTTATQTTPRALSVSSHSLIFTWPLELMIRCGQGFRR